MKYFLLFLISIISLSLKGQDTLNGNFEQWNCEEEPPLSNSWRWGVVNTPCNPYNVLMEKTDDSFSGNWAVKMESKLCYDAFGGSRLQTGRAYTAETEDPLATEHLAWSKEYSERPEQLSFYYKFHQEGVDSAAVYLLLFNYDEINHIIDTIGITSGYIHEETNEYTALTLPIEYYKEDMPSFIHILFVTSKTIGDLRILEYEPAYENAHPGTVLWIDDVALSGGTVSTTSPQDDDWNFNIYPNPVDTEIYLDIPQQIQVDKVQVYDNQGRVVKELTTFNNTLNISDIPKGIYYLKLDTNKGTRFKKVIKK